jgi:hypothetical protein
LIQNVPDLTLAVRQQICTWVSNLYTRLSSAERQTYHELSQSMSVSANIAPRVAKGDQQQRGKRRAIFLLWKALGKAQTADGDTNLRASAAMTMPPGSLDAKFSDVMLKAAVVATSLGAQEVMRKLELHPVQFLMQHRLFISGSTAGSDRFSIAPNGNYQNVVTFNFHYRAGTDQFVMTSQPITANYGFAHSFSTVSVPAVHWTAVPGVGGSPYNFGGLLGCEVTGANFMLTTQFTGCGFCWTDNGGVLRANHISSFGGGTVGYPGGSKALAQRLMASGAMANAGNTPLTVFGAGAGNAPVRTGNPFYPDPVTNKLRWVTIIGLPKGGGAWRFYTQVVDGSGNLVEARRIM